MSDESCHPEAAANTTAYLGLSKEFEKWGHSSEWEKLHAKGMKR